MTWFTHIAALVAGFILGGYVVTREWRAYMRELRERYR
jgi:membrane associated rhomboid family serine protease